MDIISFNEASTANERVQRINANPDSDSGIVTVPKKIEAGESVTVPAGRVAVLPNVQVDGTLNVEGEVFIPSGATFGDLDAQIALKAPLASPALTGTPTINGVNVSGYSGFKNYIINGKKTINQRALTSTDNSYNQDRWYKAGNNWYQGIEGDNNLVNGKTYTLSWTGTATASYYVGNATSSTINAQSFTTITKGGNFTLSISAGQSLWIKFASDATGSTFSFVQLEEGSVATPFEQRPYGLELSLCQRYYQIGQITTVFYGTAGMGWQQSVPLVQTMRTQPTTVITTPTGHTNIGTVSTASNTRVTIFSGTVVANGNTSVSTQFTASAEL